MTRGSCYIKTRKEVRIVLQLLCSLLFFAQHIEAKDSTSTLLEEVIVVKEASTTKEYSLSPSIPTDTLLNSSLKHTSLSDYLKSRAPLFLRENGNGMNSTISIRGTQASHTQVLWEGIAINSKTMGQVDFSLIPMYFIDEAEIHSGGGSALHGNGAIGGSIKLSNSTRLNRPLSIDVQSSFGSLKNIFGGASVRVGNKKIGSKTALFYQHNKNEFTFQFRGEEEIQKNADVKSWGILQELDFKLGTKGILSTKFWHTQYDREIQPMKQNNNNPLKYENIADKSTRLISYYNLYTPTKITIGLGWLNDYQRYQNEIIATNDITINFSAERTWRTKKIGKINSKIGGDVHYIQPEVDAYKEGTQDWRNTLFLLNLWEIKDWISLSANLRKDFVYQIDIPFTPSFGLRISPLHRDSLSFDALFNISKNAKVPTLNDRYWGEIDNRDLQPETGVNIEAGIQHQIKKACYKGKNSIMLYRNKVDNWILWLPRGNIWKPINVDKVLSMGIEVSSSQTIQRARHHHTLSLAYSFNLTEVKEGFSEMRPFIGQQIPLLPLHNANLLLNGEVKRLNYLLQGSYVGERHTSDIFDWMPHYFILSLQVGYKFILNQKEKRTNDYIHYLNISLLANNLLNSDYETMPYKAMPGRNFLVTLKWKMEKQNKE